MATHQIPPYCEVVLNRFSLLLNNIERIKIQRMIQQQVEILSFEYVNIKKIRQRAERTNKVRDWLALLRAYKQNNMFEQSDQTIRTMHFKFILRDDFWLEEISQRANLPIIEQKDVEIMLMGLDDSSSFKIADMIYEILIATLFSKEKRTQELRPNYVIAKIQKIIECFKGEKNYYSGLREYYKQNNNRRKARELYMRQLKQGFDNHDIVYDEYCLWQNDPKEMENLKKAYVLGREAWEKRGTLRSSKKRFEDHASLVNLQKFESEAQKLRYLRIMCLQKHEFTNQYFEKLEQLHQEDEEYVQKCFEHLQEIIPDIEMAYLRFLVRRINKHVEGEQSQEYNNTWAQKVQFFRDHVTYLINKPRLTPKTQSFIRELYYNYWIDVETSLVKDKASVCQLFEALLQIKKTVDVYTKYSQCLIRLGHYGEAKNILKRSFQANKYNYEAYKQYQNFISIYGNITEAVQFRRLKAMEKEEQQELKENEKNKLMMDIQHSEQKAIPNGKPISQTVQKEPPLIESPIEEEKKPKQPNKTNTKDSMEDQPQVKKQSQPVKQKKTFIDNFISRVAPNQSFPKAVETEQTTQHPKSKLHTDSGNTLFLKGFPNTYREQNIMQILKNKDKVKEIRLIQKKGVYQNYCYVEMESAQVAEKQVQENQFKDKYTVAISKPPSLYGQQRTLFLCGLPHTATIQKIKALFENERQEIIDVRLKLDQNKNIAYVDFSSAESLKKVLQKYSQTSLAIDSKKIIMKQSNSKPKKEPRVVILKHLAYKATARDIRDFFQDYIIEDVYIPQNQNGRSKGFGFVQFKNENEYRRVLDLKEGQIKGRKFEIVKSDRQISRPKQDRREKQRDGDKTKKEENVKGKQESRKGDYDVDNNFFSQLFK